MLKAKILRPAFLFLPFVFLLYSNGVSVADNSCFQGLSTIPGNPEYPDEWRDPYKPKIYSDNDEIARNNYVNVWVDSEGRACPTYSWSVSGTGFHFNSQSGPTTTTTNADLETLQLWADSTACGPATITVTDLCEGNDEGFVRCSNGTWTLYCQGANWAQTCAGRKDYVKYHDPETKIILGVGCHYHIGVGTPPYRCVFFSCGGYTSYLPEPPGVLLCGTRDYAGVTQCEDLGSQGCKYYSVYLTVFKWTCP